MQKKSDIVQKHDLALLSFFLIFSQEACIVLATEPLVMY